MAVVTKGGLGGSQPQSGVFIISD